MDFTFSPLNWGQFFSKNVLPTHSVPLTQDLIQFLLQDQTILPSQYFDMSSQCYIPNPQQSAQQPSYNINPNATGRNGKPIPTQHHDVLQLVVYLNDILSTFENGIMPKVDHISPSDAMWLLPDNSMKCYTAKEVMLLLSGSPKIAEYLKLYTTQYKQQQVQQQYKNTTTSPITDPINFNTTVLYKNTTKPIPNYTKTPQYHTTPAIHLRKWFNTIHPSETYRVTVQNGYIVALSQRDGIFYEEYLNNTNNPFLLSDIYTLIKLFHYNKFTPQWAKYTAFVNTQHQQQQQQQQQNNGNNNNNNNIEFDLNNLNAINNHNIVYDLYISTKTRAIRLLDIYPLDISSDMSVLYNGNNNNTNNNNNNNNNTKNTISLYNKQLDHLLFTNAELKQYARLHSMLTLAYAIYQDAEQQQNNNNNNNNNTNENEKLPITPSSFFTNTLASTNPLYKAISNHENKQRRVKSLVNMLFKRKYNNIELIIHFINLLSHLSNPQSPDITSLNHPLYYYITPVLPQIPNKRCLDLEIEFFPAPLSCDFLSTIILPQQPAKETTNGQVLVEEILTQGTAATGSITGHDNNNNTSSSGSSNNNSNNNNQINPEYTNILSSIPHTMVQMFYTLKSDIHNNEKKQDKNHILSCLQTLSTKSIDDPTSHSPTLINKKHYLYYNPLYITSVSQLTNQCIEKLVNYFETILLSEVDEDNTQKILISKLLYFLFFTFSYQEALQPGMTHIDDGMDDLEDTNGNPLDLNDFLAPQQQALQPTPTEAEEKEEEDQSDNYIRSEMLQFNAKLIEDIIALYTNQVLFVDPSTKLVDFSLSKPYYKQFFVNITNPSVQKQEQQDNTSEDLTQCRELLKYVKYSEKTQGEKDMEKNNAKQNVKKVVVFVEYPHQIVPKLFDDIHSASDNAMADGHSDNNLFKQYSSIQRLTTTDNTNQQEQQQNENLNIFFKFYQSEQNPEHYYPGHIIPFRIVMEFTRQREDERVTVAKEAARLPDHNHLFSNTNTSNPAATTPTPKDNTSVNNNTNHTEEQKFAIDVSNAQGIENFIALMKMMEMEGGDEDDDWSDEDEDEDCMD